MGNWFTKNNLGNKTNDYVNKNSFKINEINMRKIELFPYLPKIELFPYLPKIVYDCEKINNPIKIYWNEYIKSLLNAESLPDIKNLSNKAIEEKNENKFMEYEIIYMKHINSNPINNQLEIINGKHNTNALVNMFAMAYANHGLIYLSPDDLWIHFCEIVSAHILSNSEKFRSCFIDFSREMMIKICHSVHDNNWNELFDKFIAEVEKNIKTNISHQMKPDFTTTTKMEQTICQLQILNCAQKYFSFVFEPSCGIRSLYLAGTLDDWKKLREKIKLFVEYDLGEYIKIS
jgi:hypothetical protein